MLHIKSYIPQPQNQLSSLHGSMQ